MTTSMNCVQTQMENVSDGKVNIFWFIFFTMGLSYWLRLSRKIL